MHSVERATLGSVRSFPGGERELKRLRVQSKWRWVWVAGGALWMFAILAFAYPAATGQRIDAAWTIIAAVVSALWAVSAEYLTERRRKRKRKHSEE
jgi:uncharacterized membrane protein HdeD (DUF308 family)